MADNEDADGSQHTVLGLEVACALLVLFFIGQEIMQFRRNGTTYLSNPANLLDWTLFALSVAYFAIRMKQTDGSIGLHDDGGCSPPASSSNGPTGTSRCWRRRRSSPGRACSSI